MSYEEWLSSLLTVARHTASREYQEQNWFRTDIGVMSPDEVFNDLDDLAFDLFFDKYASGFTSEQVVAWNGFKVRLEEYGEKMPKYPDARAVINDPEWQLVREAAARFVAAFEQTHVESSVAN